MASREASTKASTAAVPSPSSSYKSVGEIVAILRDRGFAEPHVVQVNKGSAERPRYQDAIQWHEVVRMLDEAFGPFGFDLEIVGSTTDYANGIYTVDMKLTGRAVDDTTGEVITLVRAGRGVGLVPRSALNSDAEHDRQSHGAKSDAITNASKALGDGFGLYLYKKDEGSASSDARPARSYSGTGNGGNGGKGPRPSDKQLKVLVEHGYPAEFVEGLEFKDWKAVVNAIFDKTAPPIAAPSAPARAKGRPTVAEEEPDDIPF